MSTDSVGIKETGVNSGAHSVRVVEEELFFDGMEERSVVIPAADDDVRGLDLFISLSRGFPW
jgi:hypothetical protein